MTPLLPSTDFDTRKSGLPVFVSDLPRGTKIRSLDAAKSSARLLNVISATSACAGIEADMGAVVDLEYLDDLDFDDFFGGSGLNVGFCSFWDADEPNSTA